MSNPRKHLASLRIYLPLPPSFKNQKRSILDRNSGKQRTLTPKKIKHRMQVLEDAILSALYSTGATTGGGTHSECWRQLRIALSGLCDDSLKEVPEGSWDTEPASKLEEGITIIIEELL
jgi:hypothetical protein